MRKMLRPVDFWALLFTGLELAKAGTASNDMAWDTRSVNGPWSICGCKGCDASVWSTDASGFSCGSRIEYLFEVANTPASKACRQVGGTEFPSACGACNPDTCIPVDFTIQEELTPPSNNLQSSPSNQNHRCGCDLCETYAWQVNAGMYKQ